MSLTTADQVVLHLIGDYVLQSHWMATCKTKAHTPALAHALMYTVPFVMLTTSIPALLIILASHFVVDRWRLARYVVWLKNKVFAPRGECPPWDECQATGYPGDTPPWLAVWLLIVCDNVIHIVCNAAALRVFP